ncbi:MAG: hypothetical protein V3V27_02880 [Candidatus Thermoplasmatota archaeon]
MIQGSKIFTFILLLALISNVLVSINAKGCKDIIAVGDATEGDYNLLMKVRDPTRSGPQVLCIVPEGYKYSYHHPWTGKTLQFTVQHKFIGVATNDDIIPNIVKAGMSLNDAGIAFGDADTNSNWKNPTKNAWDDFDWIRYACEKADDEDEAVKLLTEDLVDDMHASGVSENLFVVGPKKAFLVEADAFHYAIKEVDDLLVMSNYPKELWKTQRHKKLPIASSFDIEKEQYVRQGRVIRLNSLYGVKIVEIGEDYVVARQIPFIKFNKVLRIVGNKVKIELGKRETVGDYSVKLLDIDEKKAKISVCYVFKAWEDKMLEYMQPKYGGIKVKDMMNWSRLTGEDLDGLRPMCEEIYPYESVMIYKIPEEKYDVLSSGWFSANHACSSIYVPVHICDIDIYEPYKTGEAAELSLELLGSYGNQDLIPYICNVENVFLHETEDMEEIAEELLQNNLDVSSFLTVVDMGMQKQAMLTQQIWSEAFEQELEDANLIKNMWQNNYSYSLEMMENVIYALNNSSKSSVVFDKIIEIVLSICETRMDAAEFLVKDISTVEEEFETGQKSLQRGQYQSGFDHLLKAYSYSNMLLNGEETPWINTGDIETSKNEEIWTDFNIFLMAILCITVFVILVKKKYYE